jgi:pimeloyl-ACP methyl ester carboxylesterase
MTLVKLIKVRIVIAGLLLLSFAANGILFAQTTRQVLYPKGAKNQIHKDKPPCAGGWKGVVTYTKTLKDSLESDDPGIRKSIDRIKHKTSRDYQYTGRAVVEGSDPMNAKVNTNVSFTDNDLSWGQEKVFDTCNSRENGHWFVIEGTDDKQTQAQVSGSADSFNLSVNEFAGTYQFSLGFPDAQGRYKREEHVKRTGHCQPKNNEPYDRSTDEATKVEGASFTIDSQPIDPKNSDQLSGTKIWGDDGKGQVRTFIYQATWYFTRCPAKLLVTGLRYEHPDFPDFDNWNEVEERRGTIDGNRVKIKAKVLNLSSEAKYAEVKIKETFEAIGPGYKPPPDQEMTDGQFNVKLEPGEEREVEMIWDTEGQSWNDYGQENRIHYIKAEAWEGQKKEDEKEKDLYIYPKPLVLVHGLWSSADAWIPLYQNLLGGYGTGWKAYPVGEKPEHGKLNTGGAFLSASKSNSLYENADELEKYIKYAQDDSNAWHVDIVAHSLGGLISRLYIHRQMPNMPDNKPQVKHLVMLGTPNAGSPCADTIDMKFRLYGERVQAVKDLKPENVAIFNQYVRDRKQVKFSALAGNVVPVMCGGYMWNDGVVSVDSAINGMDDFAYSNDVHTELTDARNFGNFVYPHIVTGPKGTYPLPVKSDPNDIDRWTIKNGKLIGEPNVPSFLDIGKFDAVAAIFTNGERRGGPNAEDSSQPTAVVDDTPFSQELEIAPGQSVELNVPVGKAPVFGLTFLADPKVSATLSDETGKVRGTNLAGSAESKTPFRSIFVQKGAQSGQWKLKLENTGSVRNIVLVASWSIDDPLMLTVAAGKLTATKQIPIKAELIKNGVDLTGARITARVNGGDPIPLYDDGQHGDGAASDGVYGGFAGGLTDGSYSVLATADFNGTVRTAATGFTVGGAAAAPPKPAVAKPVSAKLSTTVVKK